MASGFRLKGENRMNKTLVEIEYEYLDDLLDHQDRVAEGLINILDDPDPTTADSWTISFVRPLFGRHGEIVLRRVQTSASTVKTDE